MRSVAVVMSAVAAVTLAAGGASAATMIATFEGRVTQGYDDTGLFGSLTGDLTGYAVTLKFSYDTALFVAGSDSDTAISYHSIPEHSQGPGKAFATAFINGRSISTTHYDDAYNEALMGIIREPGFYNLSFTTFTGTTEVVDRSTEDTPLGTKYSLYSTDISVNVDTTALPFDLGAPFTADITGANGGSFLFAGTCYYEHVQNEPGDIHGAPCASQNVQASFAFDRVTVAVAPVPLPASALLLGAALTGLGLARRRR